MVGQGTNAPWKRVRVTSWRDFQQEIEPFLDGSYLFRGVASVRHQLVPSVGRKREGYGYSLALERALFDQFKREALPFLAVRPENDWEWLALAQHHGVPTRLLDWSESPSVSLFFSVWGNADEDAGLYIVRRPNEVEELGRHPFHVKNVLFFYPGYVTQRLVSQRGLFTVHPRPEEPYTTGDMQQIVIGMECKADFRRKLDSSGIHHAAIFADLDGLSRRLVALQGYRFTPPGAPSLPGTAPSGPAIERAKAMRRRKIKMPSDAVTHKINPRDPQKGQWGGLPTRNGWTVSAAVTMVEEDWYKIVLTVGAAPKTKKVLSGNITFHLHDTFANAIRTVKARKGAAVVTLWAYGAFTVGVLIEQDNTTLELDLAEVASAPKRFRQQ